MNGQHSTSASESSPIAAKRKRKSIDWPKSPFRAATRPRVPVYIKVGMTLPAWRTQMPTLHKVADHLNTPTADLMAFAAMAYLAQFTTKEEMMGALKRARSKYALQGHPVKLKFYLDWPDNTVGRRDALHPERL